MNKIRREEESVFSWTQKNRGHRPGMSALAIGTIVAGKSSTWSSAPSYSHSCCCFLSVPSMPRIRRRSPVLMAVIWTCSLYGYITEEAKKAGIEGRVYTAFTINKEGKLVNLRLLRGVHPLLDEEAIRVIESAPQIWKPGENRKGEPIDVNYTFPVFFKLVEEWLPE